MHNAPMARKSLFEGESLMLVLHPVFLVATIAHLIGYGARRLWYAVIGKPDEPDPERDASAD